MTRILVVEDSPTQAEELRLILEHHGFDVETAGNGQAALARLAGGELDLVLSDVLMPEMSGYDLCRRIKAEPATRALPVVLLTYLADPLDVLRGLECGADNFLTKPYEPAYLVHRLRSILENAGRAPDQAGTPLVFRGQGVTITADKAQILDLLLAALDELIRARERDREARAVGVALAEASKRKNHFLAMLAHELRNPLAPLLTGLHVLRHSQEGAARGQALDGAERQVRHLSRLVEDLVDASQVSEGQMRLRRSRLDLARLARTVAEDLRRRLEDAGLSLRVETPEVPVWVNGDDTRLSHVIHNLLDNAARFSEWGGRVTLRLTVAEGEAVLTVLDTGIGIERSELDGLFEVLWQAKQSLDRRRGGLGLGLVVVRGVVEMHGGRVRAFSAGPGRGAEITVALPLEPEPAALTGTPPEPPGSQARQRILVVEDNRDAADNLRLFLELVGHEVAVAYTGTDGVRLAGEMRPGVVISDIGLPGLDGYAVAAALRGDPQTAGVLLIGVSGYGQEGDIRRAREAGFDHYLVKPADPEQILQFLAARASRA
jgi:CheY-like chemotaxis protein/two-component sensor histidine kinase